MWIWTLKVPLHGGGGLRDQADSAGKGEPSAAAFGGRRRPCAGSTRSVRPFLSVGSCLQ
ncbi:hypothetical protein M885DRAFT_528330 [Pelagophyceae sp. CCMP2097]|nr:hypothetical protein M885DRAFT_528330 [Pelagophyceae sp. CCMP2097]